MRIGIVGATAAFPSSGFCSWMLVTKLRDTSWSFPLKDGRH
jgi:hypothetical protein